MNNTLRIALRSGLTALALVLLAQCSANKSSNEGASKTTETATEGCYQDGPNCLPPMDYIDEDGKVWTPEELKGKVVIINFWATWCKPCQREIPDLARVYRKYKEKDVVMLGFMTDEVDDKKLKAFSDKYGLDYPVVRVLPEVSEAFGHPRNLPTNFVYSRTGHLVFDSPGAMTAGALEREVKELL